MGVCCSRTAKPTSTSSSRHYVSVCNSPSTFPTENEYQQDCALASYIDERCSHFENAVEKASVKDFNNERSTSGFVEMGVHPMWVEHRQEMAKHRLHREGESSEDVSRQRHLRTDSAEKWSIESFTENDDGDNKVIASKPRCAGAIPRLKKKDSTRRPKYKDEIMLSDNIDSIVEKEIPEITGKGSELTEDILHVLNDDIPAKESNEVKARYTEEGDAASSPFAISSVSIPPLQKNLHQETMDEEDLRVEEEIKRMLKDEPLKDESNTTTPPSAGAASNTRTEEATKQPKHMMTSEQVVQEVDLDAPTTPCLTQMHSDSLAILGTKQHTKKCPTRKNDITDDEKLALDIDYILSDDVGADESHSQISSGKVSPTKKAQRPKKYSVKEQNNIDDKELMQDIDYILNDDVGADESNGKFSSGTVSPLKITQRPIKHSTEERKKADDEKRTSDIKYILSDATTEPNDKICDRTVSPTKRVQRPPKYSTEKQNMVDKVAKKDDLGPENESITPTSPGTVLPTKNAQRSMEYFTKEIKNTEDEKLAKDVNYILSDEVGAGEYDGEISSGNVSPPKTAKRPKKYSTTITESMASKEPADDVNCILNDNVATVESNGEMSSGAVSPTKPAQRPHKKYSARKNERIDDKKLATDISDDTPAIKSISKSRISSGKASPKKKVSFQEPNQEDDDLATNVKYILDGDDIAKDVPNGNISLNLGALPPPKKDFTRKHSKQADDQLAKDIAYILNDDIFAVETDDPISSSPSEIPRPKTSNPKLSLAMDMDKIFDPESIVSSNQVDDELEEDIEYILNDDLVDVASNVPIPLRTGAERRLKKQSLRTAKKADDELLKRNHTLNDETVQGTSNEPISSSPGETRRPRKKIPTRNSRYVTNADDMAEESSSKASKASPSPPSRPQSDFSSSPSTARRLKTDSTRTRENIEDKALSKDIDYIVKEELHSAESTQPTSCTSSSLPRPKSRNPKRALAMNMNKNQHSSPAASSSRAVPRPKQDFSRKPRQAACKLAKAGSVQGTSSGETHSNASAVPCTNNYATRKSKDMLIQKSCVIPQSSNDSTLEQNHAKQHSTKQPKETEGENLDEIINEILDIPAADSGALGEKRTDVRTSLTKNSTRQPKQSKHTEENDLEEAINEILEIPTLESDSKPITKLKSTGKQRQAKPRKDDTVKAPSSSPGQSISTCKGILAKGVQKPRMQADRETAVPKQRSMATKRRAPAHVSSGYSPSTSPGIFYETGELNLMEQIERESSQVLRGACVSHTELPIANASASSIKTKNSGSGCSVVSEDSMRPMAAVSSRVKSSASSETVKLPSSNATKRQLSKRRQTLPAILRNEGNTMRKPRIRASRETAVPSLGRVENKATHRTSAVPLMAVASNQNVTPGIVYESDELNLIKQIESESRRH